MKPQQGLDTPFAPCLRAFNGIEKELNAEGLFALAFWLDDARESDAALRYYQMAVKADPHLAEAHHNMGVIHKDRQNNGQAAYHFKKAIQLNPSLADSRSALAVLLLGRHQYEDALAQLTQAIEINPGLADAHYHMGVILQEMGRYRLGLECFRRALDCNSGFASARWRYLLSLPMIYRDSGQIDQVRERYGQNLDRLAASLRFDTPENIEYAMQGIRTATNFYLQYQGRNDLVLQQKYGRLVTAAMNAAYPHLNCIPSLPPVSPGGALRVGYVSSLMHRHTIGTFLSGWVENHAAAVQVHSYHVGQICDDLTDRIRKASHRFYHLPGEVEKTATQILADRLHILVFSDIGMNIEMTQLAGLRLAPIQCKGWGHPVTTGLPTIDYYLSSDLMEPDRAASHYSEVLVRLPNLALCYEPPELPAAAMDIGTLGIDEDRFVFLSPQSIFKYLPQYDDIFPVIARAAPRACFVFICHQSRTATRIFHDRLRAVFHRHRLECDDFCYFAPRLSMKDFLALNMASDVLLDTFDWSGGKTTLEAISCGLPVVTFPGRFMRGRHAYAMLTRMGVDYTIGHDVPSYCRIAVRLATDRPFRERARADVAYRRHKLYHDMDFMAALERFYHDAVQRHSQQGPMSGH